MRFRAEQHLRRQLDFQHVRTHGRRHDCGAFMLWYARQASPDEPRTTTPNMEGSVSDPTPIPDAAPIPASQETESATVISPRPARLGVVASRSAIGNAVQRARAKRRLREIFRHHQHCVPAGYDVLLVGRNSLNRLEYRVIEQRFVDACRKLFPSAHT